MTDFYHESCLKFFQQTANIDPSSFLGSFARAIPAGISILDVGCGSGRDLLWLKNQGFKVTGFERSAGLADLARKHSGCKVIEGDFEFYDFSRLNVDAILAAGSLVHIPHQNLPGVLANIINAFKPESADERFMYISMKAGSGIKKDAENRIFYLWEEKSLKPLFEDLGFAIIHVSKSASVKNSKDLWIGYVLNMIASPSPSLKSTDTPTAAQ